MLNQHEQWIVAISSILITLSFSFAFGVEEHPNWYYYVGGWLLGALGVSGLYVIWDVRLSERRPFPWHYEASPMPASPESSFLPHGNSSSLDASQSSHV